MVVWVQDCLHSALSVLMNVTHNNAAGCSCAAGAGAVENASALISRVVAAEGGFHHI